MGIISATKVAPRNVYIIFLSITHAIFLFNIIKEVEYLLMIFRDHLSLFIDIFRIKLGGIS